MIKVGSKIKEYRIDINITKKEVEFKESDYKIIFVNEYNYAINDMHISSSTYQETCVTSKKEISHDKVWVSHMDYSFGDKEIYAKLNTFETDAKKVKVRMKKEIQNYIDKKFGIWISTNVSELIEKI